MFGSSKTQLTVGKSHKNEKPSEKQRRSPSCAYFRTLVLFKIDLPDLLTGREDLRSKFFKSQCNNDYTFLCFLTRGQRKLAVVILLSGARNAALFYFSDPIPVCLVYLSNCVLEFGDLFLWF